MKKILKLAAVGVSAFMLCSYIGQNNYVQPSAVEQTDIDDAEKEQQQVQNKIDSLQKELDSLASDITDTENYISQLDTKLAGYTSQLVECQGKIDAKQTEIDAKKQQIADKQAEIDSAQAELDAAKETEKEQYEAMKLRIQYMYECGDSTFLDMIFSAEDLSDMLGKAEYVNSIVEYDRNQLKKLADTQNTISGLISTMETDKAALETEKTTLQNEQNELLALQTDLQNQQKYIDVILDEKESKLTVLEGQQQNAITAKAAAEKELEEQKQIVANIKAEWQRQQEEARNNGTDASQEAQKTLEQIGLAGGFTWPIPGYNIITSEWGTRYHPILHFTTLHDGMDISGGGIYGKPIVAAYSGTVSIADNSNATSGYGYYVKIDHGVGVSTLYAHCSLLAVSVGQQVQAGQVIGYIGSTGNSTGAHLHFSVFVQGESKNPRDYITIPSY